MPEAPFVPGGLGTHPNPLPPVEPPPVAPSGNETSGMDVVVFIAGIGGLLASLGGCCCWLTFIVSLPAGLFAWIAGQRERRRAREESRQPHGLLTAGWVMGIIATAISLLWAIFFLAYLVIVGTMFSMGAWKGF